MSKTGNDPHSDFSWYRVRWDTAEETFEKFPNTGRQDDDHKLLLALQERRDAKLQRRHERSVVSINESSYNEYLKSLSNR